MHWSKDMKKAETINLKCPKCGEENKAMQVNTRKIIIKCKTCGSLIEYELGKRKTKNMSRQIRTSSSGITFY